MEALGVAESNLVPSVVLVPIGHGELVDKITILEIKLARIHNEAKRANVSRELVLLREVERLSIVESEGLLARKERLRQVNEALWDVEDRLRQLESVQAFGDEFVELARSVYRLNDERAAIKRAINEHTGSTVIEEKSYFRSEPSERP